MVLEYNCPYVIEFLVTFYCLILTKVIFALFCSIQKFFLGIVKYMKSQVGPSSKELTSVEEFEKFLKVENDVSVVGFFEKESDLKTAFLKLADKLREKVRFAHSTFKDVLEKQGVK